MQELTIWNEPALLRLFTGLEEHLAVEAVIQGKAAGKVWVDEPLAPRTGVIWVQHRVFVTGEAQNGESAAGLNKVLCDIAATARARGDWGIGVYGAEGVKWEPILAGMAWKSLEREYWEVDKAAWKSLGADGQEAQETGKQTYGLSLRPVDRELMATARLERIEQLREEMCSERPSVEDFLAGSFGVCLVDEVQNALAGWCLSEYNCGARCEARGIERDQSLRGGMSRFCEALAPSTTPAATTLRRPAAARRRAPVDPVSLCCEMKQTASEGARSSLLRVS